MGSPILHIKNNKQPNQRLPWTPGLPWRLNGCCNILSATRQLTISSSLGEEDFCPFHLVKGSSPAMRLFDSVTIFGLLFNQEPPCYTQEALDLVDLSCQAALSPLCILPVLFWGGSNSELENSRINLSLFLYSMVSNRQFSFFIKKKKWETPNIGL